MSTEFGKLFYPILKDLSRDDVVHFTWLCAVRALPFLGAMGSFGYWIENERQMNLLTVLRKLDVAVVADAYLASRINAATEYTFTVITEGNPLWQSAENAVGATRAACDAARCPPDKDIREYLIKFASSAISSTSDAAKACGIDLVSDIQQDLDAIKTRKRNFNGDTTVYGDIWGNFQKALHDLDCAYWGDWYTALFEKGFILEDTDRNEIKKRLEAPTKIEGALAVSYYMVRHKQSAQCLG